MVDLLFSFRGRVNRARFWLVALGIVVVEAIAFAAMGGAAMLSSESTEPLAAIGPLSGIVMAVVVLAATWISLAVAVKRYHDRDKSGWWVLVLLVPVIGHLWYLIECGFLPGTPGANAYGPDSLAPS
jgi:uncharacterized membrane protein YhaH (DUF805 family)